MPLLLRHHARGVTLTAAASSSSSPAPTAAQSAGELLSEAQGLGTALTGSLTLGCFSVLTLRATRRFTQRARSAIPGCGS